MKILFLTDGIHPFQLGGMQKHSLILSQLLVQKGIDLSLVHCGGRDYSPDSFQNLYGDKGVVNELVIEFPSMDKLPGHYIRENKAYSKVIYNSVRNQLSDFDLIYAQGFSGWEFIRNRAENNNVPPVLLNFHGYEMFQKAPSLRVKIEYLLFKKAVKWNVLNADYVYSFGGEIDHILIELGLPKNRILSHSNGIMKEWLLQTEIKNNSTLKFVFVGRNERRKGIQELNSALKNICKQENVKFTFDFVGPIPKEDRVEDKRLIYHGEIRDQEQIKKILRDADCLVCPSHSEGMPTVILEGMASALAVVATKVGAVERQIKGNGILIENLTVNKLENALLTMINLEDSELLAFKKKSVELIKESFLWEVIANQKIADFNEVLKK